MVQDQDLTQNCISWYDRQFLTGKEQLKTIELKIQKDARFPTYASFITYVQQYPKEAYLITNDVILNFLGSATLANGQIRHRFSLTSQINGAVFKRPVLAKESSDGKPGFQLAGIAD